MQVQNQTSGQIKNFAKTLPSTAWIFVFTLSIAPILVGIIEATLRDWFEINSLLGNFASLSNFWSIVIFPSVSYALVLGSIGWLLMFIPTIAWFQAQTFMIKATVLGILLCLTLAIFWATIAQMFLAIFFESYYGPVLGWPVIPTWINIFGWIWTSGIVFFFVYSLRKSRSRIDRA